MQEEEELVRRAIEGDERSFTVLMNRYKTVIFRLALALLRHWENAEDATQDTFIPAFRKLKTLKNASSFPIWLRKLAIRVCLRYRRRCIVEQELVELLNWRF